MCTQYCVEGYAGKYEHKDYTKLTAYLPKKHEQHKQKKIERNEKK